MQCHVSQKVSVAKMLLILLFANLILRFLRSVLFANVKIYLTLERVFHHITSPRSSPKNTPLRVVFPTIFSVFGNVMKNSLS